MNKSNQVIALVEWLLEQNTIDPDHSKPPYIKKYDDRGKLKIWIVDGDYVRREINEEFTTCGFFLTDKFIPNNEIWLDNEGSSDENEFYISNLLTQYKLMSNGVSEEEAAIEGSRIENLEREKADYINGIVHNDVDVYIKLLKKLENDIEIWKVDGEVVRDEYYLDFTAGGHWYIYSFIPKNEIWIDNDVQLKEVELVILHELHERKRMTEGWSYEKAHRESSKIEHYCRHHPEELQDYLSKEGYR